MMYIVTGVLLGFGVETRNSYLLLLPLLVIIPSYFIAIDYEKCVNVAATYLKVFYEEKKGFPIRWETRKVYLDHYLRQTSESYIPSFNKQDLPYRVSAMACVLIYFWVCGIEYLSKCAESLLAGEMPAGFPELLLGIAALVIVVMTVFKFNAVSFEDCWKAWEKIREKEESCESEQNIGDKEQPVAFDTLKAYEEINKDTTTVGLLTKIKWIVSGKKPESIYEESCQEK